MREGVDPIDRRLRSDLESQQHKWWHTAAADTAVSESGAFAVCAERACNVCERKASLCDSDDAYMLLVSLRRRSIHTPHAVIPVYLVAMLTLQQAVWVVQYREGRCEGCVCSGGV